MIEKQLKPPKPNLRKIKPQQISLKQVFNLNNHIQDSAFNGWSFVLPDLLI